MNSDHTIEEIQICINELRDAGWIQKLKGVWKGKDGRLYANTYRAWKVMLRQRNDSRLEEAGEQPEG